MLYKSCRELHYMGARYASRSKFKFPEGHFYWVKASTQSHFLSKNIRLLRIITIIYFLYFLKDYLNIYKNSPSLNFYIIFSFFLASLCIFIGCFVPFTDIPAYITLYLISLTNYILIQILKVIYLLGFFQLLIAIEYLEKKVFWIK